MNNLDSLDSLIVFDNERLDNLSEDVVMALEQGRYKKEGVSREILQNCIEDYCEVIGRFNKNFSKDLSVISAFRFIAKLAVFEDYGEEIFDRKSQMEAQRLLEEYYSNPFDYGVSMNAFSDFVGVKGTTLKKFLFDSRFN